MKLIDKLLKEGQKIVDAALVPFVRDEVKRALESAKSNAQKTQVQANIEIAKLRLKLVSEPESAERTVNEIIKKKSEIMSAERVINWIEEEQNELFTDKKE